MFNEDKYALILKETSSKLLVSIAVEIGRHLKEGDFKNSFYKDIITDDEIFIVNQPIGCP